MVPKDWDNKTLANGVSVLQKSEGLGFALAGDPMPLAISALTAGGRMHSCQLTKICRPE